MSALQVFSVVLFLTATPIYGLYPLEDIIRSYEKEYGLVFDVPAVLSNHYEREQSSIIARNVLQLGINIGSRVAMESYDGAQIYSPLSIASALSVLMLGSNGATFKELMGVLTDHKDSQFIQNPHKLHEQFGRALDDLAKTSPMKDKRSSHYRQDPYRANLANGLFLQDGITLRRDFKSSVQSIYKAELSTLDFQWNSERARGFINNWAEKKTNGKIQDLIPGPIPFDTKMIIVSALYFRGLWENSFMKRATMKRNFYPDGIHSKAISVMMMSTTGMLPYYESIEHACSIVGLPYKGNHATMFLILPHDSNRQKLIELQTELSANVIDDMISRMELRNVLVSMPKMHLKISINLKQTLSDMGLSSLFDSEECDLSLMATEDSSKEQSFRHQKQLLFSKIDDFNEAPVRYEVNRIRRRTRQQRINAAKNLDNLRNSENLEIPDIYVDDIMHKLDLNINESGAEGAAATASSLLRADFDDVFLADAPFLLLIRHNPTALPLFYGAVFDPRG